MFSKNISIPAGIPKIYCIIIAIPPTPELINPCGIVKVFIEIADIKLPKIICSILLVFFKLSVEIIIPPDIKLG